MILIIIMLFFIGAVDVFILGLFVRSWQKHNQDFGVLADEIIAKKIKEEICILHSDDYVIRMYGELQEALDSLKQDVEICRRFVANSLNGVKNEEVDFNCNDDVDNDLYIF